MAETKANPNTQAFANDKVARRRRGRVVCWMGLAVVLASSTAIAQGRSPEPNQNRPVTLTLDQAVEFALSHYPAIRVVLAQASASRSGVDLARTAYLPRTDLVWQANRATRNNVFGLFFPQPIPLPISGPVLGTNNGTNVWGTAAGFLFNWEPFDLGLRKAQVSTARAEEAQAKTAIEVTRQDVAVAAADGFLTLVASQQAVRVAQASVDRARVLANTIDVLVKNELRPGADASRAKAELAAAETQLIQAQQSEQISRVTLAQLLGIAGTAVTIQEGPLLQMPPSIEMPASATTHPLANFQAAVVDVVKARQKELERAYFPKFDFQAATFGRGSGALTNGETLGGLNGLAPNTFNWAVGFTAKFQLFDFSSIRSRKEIEKQLATAESARFDQVVQSLTAQNERARAEVEGARRVAENTPIQLDAAKATEAQVRARYQAGLATVVDVADAQRLLAQAEIEDSLARLRVWRALLTLAASRGDLGPFLQAVRK
ncbi:MAG TPA: TolC family protein [Terriglobia bacterium]|nr:TolC family protein [Terriglobia bacterium]